MFSALSFGETVGFFVLMAFSLAGFVHLIRTNQGTNFRKLVSIFVPTAMMILLFRTYGMIVTDVQAQPELMGTPNGRAYLIGMAFLMAGISVFLLGNINRWSSAVLERVPVQNDP